MSQDNFTKALFHDLPFNHQDIMSWVMLNPQEMILKAHLTIGKVIELFVEVQSGSDKILDDARLSFSSKLAIAKNLEMDSNLSAFFKKINRIRNKFAHDLSYQISEEDVEDLRALYNAISYSNAPKIEGDFEVTFSGNVSIYSVVGRFDRTAKYSEASLRERLLTIITNLFVLKLPGYIHITRLQKDPAGAFSGLDLT